MLEVPVEPPAGVDPLPLAYQANPLPHVLRRPNGYSFPATCVVEVEILLPDSVGVSVRPQDPASGMQRDRPGTNLVQAVGIEPTGSEERRFYGPLPYLHGGACKMAEETGVEPACAGISGTDWFSGPASHRGTPLPFWWRVRDLNSRRLAALLVSSEVV